MNLRIIGYWIATGLFCLTMAGGGTANLLRVEEQQEMLSELGYPTYLMTILGIAKLLGVVALLLPKTPLLKEWAYAGFTFDLLGAAASHAMIGHPVTETIAPLIVLAIALASYWLRPAVRRLPPTSHVHTDAPGHE